MTLSIERAALAAIHCIAPHELDFFHEVTAAWVAHELPYQRGSRRLAVGTVGSGLDVSLISEVVYAVISGAVIEVLGAAAADAWRNRGWGRRGGRKGGAALSAKADVVLADGDGERLRAACRRHGTALGLSEDQAALLADAVYGAVRSAQEH